MKTVDRVRLLKLPRLKSSSLQTPHLRFTIQRIEILKNWSDRQYLDIQDRVTPELKHTINVLAILNQQAPDAFDKFVEVTTVSSANGNAKNKRLPAKTKKQASK